MDDKELTRGDELRKALLYERKNGYDRMEPGEREAMEAYCRGYKQFLDAGKTERECVARTVAENGFSVVYDTASGLFAQFEAQKFQGDAEAGEPDAQEGPRLCAGAVRREDFVCCRLRGTRSAGGGSLRA